VHLNKFLFINQPDALIIQIYSVIKLYISDSQPRTLPRGNARCRNNKCFTVEIFWGE